MNIENEVKTILRSGLSIDNKISSIKKISNFKEEHILMAMRTNFEDEKDVYSKIYRELVMLDTHGK